VKILFQNQPENWLGGDVIQCQLTRKYLEKLGVKTAFSSKMTPDPEDIMDADWVHCFNFSMPWTKYQIWNAKKLGKKVAVSMIYHETDEYVDYVFQQAMINEVDVCIFLTDGELARARRHLSIPTHKIYFLPNGLEKWWFTKTKGMPVDVLTVGRLDANKGQLTVAQACKRLGLSYMCIGENSRYGDLVKAEGAIVVAPMTQKELKKHYSGCKVYAQVSYKEVMPLTVMEAGAQAKNIVLTNGCEWQIPCDRAEYNDVDSICDALTKALAREPNIAFKKELKKMTWERVAKELKTIYEM